MSKGRGLRPSKQVSRGPADSSRFPDWRRRSGNFVFEDGVFFEEQLILIIQERFVIYRNIG